MSGLSASAREGMNEERLVAVARGAAAGLRLLLTGPDCLQDLGIVGGVGLELPSILERWAYASLSRFCSHATAIRSSRSVFPRA